MATRRTTRTTHTHTYSAKAWMFKLSFWLVVIIGAAMAITGILHVIGVTAFDAAGAWIQRVCMAIALIIPVIMSYQVARYKSTLWFVLWIIFVVLIVVGIILGGISL